LDKFAEGDTRYKTPTQKLLANYRLWPDNQNGSEEGFVRLKKFAASKLDAIGVRYETDVYEAKDLGAKLGHVGHEIPRVESKRLKRPLRPRQDAHLPMPPDLEVDEEYIDTSYISLLSSAAHALDPVFQETARQICQGAGGESKSPHPKGFMRMYAKLEHDHADAKRPKAAENLDVNRIAWIFEDEAQLRDAYAKAREVFGSPVRVKNGYDPAFNAMEISKGYRNILANYNFKPAGLSWGKLVSKNKQMAARTQSALKKLRSGILKNFLRMEKLPCEDHLDNELKHYLQAFDESKDHLQSKSMSNKPAALIVEVQYMLRPYMEMRQFTHAWYKIVRAETAEALVMDYNS